MSEEMKPRARKKPVASVPKEPTKADYVQRIRNGDFLAVIEEVGSTEYNKLRIEALKK